MALFGIQANIRRQRFLGKGGGGMVAMAMGLLTNVTEK